jgi:diguanylate cyclase (GGDEF)-like protein
MIRVAIIFMLLFVIFNIILKQLVLEYTIEQNREKVDNILTTHLALHSYIEGTQKPVFYELKQNGKLYNDFFDPRVLSFTYMVRNFHYKFNELKEKSNQSQYYYKLASTNPRNELNTADEYEAKVLKEFNKNRELKKIEKIVQDSNNKTYLYYMKPIGANKQSCLRCHGEPKNAPKEMLDMYGDKKGFYEKVGDIRAMISIKLPLEKEIKEADRFYLLVSSIAFGVLVVIYLIIFYLYKLVKSRDDQIAKKNDELEEMSKRDALTKAYNRHYLDKRFTHDIESSIDTDLSVMMIDIDHFKSINDTYGHLVGDDVLISLGKDIQTIIDEDDIFYRYGGEEFLIVMPNKNKERAYNLAQKLRTTIEKSLIGDVSVTISIGLAYLKQNDTADSIIKRADEALYRAKDSGRNRVEESE